MVQFWCFQYLPSITFPSRSLYLNLHLRFIPSDDDPSLVLQEEEPAFSYFHFEFFGAAPKARPKTEPTPEPQPRPDPRSPLNEKNGEPAAPGALTMSDEVVEQVGLEGDSKA